MSPFLECFAKIEWAETAINDLKIKIDGLFRPVPSVAMFAPVRYPGDRLRGYPPPYPTGLYKSVKHIDPNGVEVWRYVAPDIPASFSVDAGAILHNLRSPLDQMLSTIALRTHNSPRGVSFPFGRDQKEFEANLAGQKKLSPDVHKAIAIPKPYKTGNPLLYALHALNNPDKHHPGLVPVNMQTVTRAGMCRVFKGKLLTIGPRTGRHVIAEMDGNFSQLDEAKRPGVILARDPMDSHMILGFPAGKPPKHLCVTLYNQTGSKPGPDLAEWIAKTKLPPGAPKDDMEIATCVPGTDFEIEASPSFNIALGDIEGFERESVITVLHKLRELVERILRQFERGFP